MNEKGKNPIQSAGRIFGVLELLAKNGAMGVTEIGAVLELNKSTVHRLLASLITMGYAKKDESTEKYALTYKLVNMASSVQEHTGIVDIAHPFLKELSRECKETVHLVQREQGKIIYIDKVEYYTNSAIRMVSRIGLSHPIFTTGVGKIMLAYMQEEKVESLWKQYSPKKYTEHTITDYEHLLEELKVTRARGYALDNEENELGVRCIAGSIFDYRGRCENAFSISAPISRMTDEHVLKLSSMVLKYSGKISEAYGYRV